MARFGAHKFFVGIACLIWASASNGSDVVWQQLEPGLELGSAVSKTSGVPAGSVINIVRIEPGMFDFRLLNASARNNVSKTPKQWAETEDLVAVINASMFQEDLVTSVSLMRDGNHVNNGYQSGDRAMLVFNPKTEEADPVRILDAQCEDLNAEMARYHTIIQSIRMISCEGRNVWRPQIKRWSTAAIATDEQGMVLFIQTEAAFSTHELINELLELPLNIERAMYVEGGPQAQLYVAAGGLTFEFSGQISPYFLGRSRLSWPLPNVVGVSRKPRP